MSNGSVNGYGEHDSRKLFPAPRLPVSPSSSSSKVESGYSGSRVVMIGLLAIGVLMGGGFVAYQIYLKEYRRLAAITEQEVIPVLSGFAKVTPTGWESETRILEWRTWVEATQDAGRKALKSGVFDQGAIDRFRDSWAGHVSRTRPETAVTDLLKVWIELEVLAGPKIADSRSGDPRAFLPISVRNGLGLAMTLPLREGQPPTGVDRTQWRQTMSDLRLMLALVVVINVDSKNQASAELREFSDQVRKSSAQLGSHPAEGASELLKLWDEAEKRFPATLKRLDCPKKPTLSKI